VPTLEIDAGTDGDNGSIATHCGPLSGATRLKCKSDPQINLPATRKRSDCPRDVAIEQRQAARGAIHDKAEEREVLIQEWYNGREALKEDGVAGAGRFKDGLGRHGDFDRIR
jgi:hypothetical protein